MWISQRWATSTILWGNLASLVLLTVSCHPDGSNRELSSRITFSERGLTKKISNYKKRVAEDPTHARYFGPPVAPAPNWEAVVSDYIRANNLNTATFDGWECVATYNRFSAVPSGWSDSLPSGALVRRTRVLLIEDPKFLSGALYFPGDSGSFEFEVETCIIKRSECGNPLW
jgi:hypothetical protein